MKSQNLVEIYRDSNKNFLNYSMCNVKAKTEIVIGAWTRATLEEKMACLIGFKAFENYHKVLKNNAFSFAFSMSCLPLVFSKSRLVHFILLLLIDFETFNLAYNFCY